MKKCKVLLLLKNRAWVPGIFFLIIISLGLGLNLSCSKATTPDESTNIQKSDTTPTPPMAEKIKKELTIHNHTRVDNYYWLNQRDNPKVIDYLNAENQYLKAVMKHTEPLQEKLYNEMAGRLKPNDATTPFKDNGYYYYKRFNLGQEYPVYCRKKGTQEAPEEIMLELNEMAKGYKYYHINELTVSPDNQWLAYGEDTVSRRLYTIHFKNLTSGQILEEKIPNTTGNAAWANDNQTVFYIQQNDALRPYKIYKHRLGTPVNDDPLIFHETDETFGVNVSRSNSGQYIFIESQSTLASEFQFLDANQPDKPFTIFEPRQKDHLYFLKHYKNKFYIRTNWDAKNFRLMEAKNEKTTREHWQELIPHQQDVLIEEFLVFKDYLVVQERKQGLTHLHVIKWDTREEHNIDFGEETYVAELFPWGEYDVKNAEFDTSQVRFFYGSLTTPDTVIDYNMNTHEKFIRKQDEVQGGFSPENYHAERLYATAADGTQIPISLVYRKGLEKNGNNPLLLGGYGSYGSSTEPYFNVTYLSLLDRGFVYALAHVRGGQEMGRYWYEEGKLLKKKNTFTDFIACADHLVKEKLTNPKKLFAQGGSAGGLLMGAIVNMRPDLFKGVIAAVPYVDVVTTMLDESIPLTTVEYDEWGDPRIKEYYDYMLSYSPYDNVASVDYPALLVTTGLHDSQVQYWEPAKWVAKMRTMKTDSNPLLLYTNMDTGHSGATGRFKRYKETALIYAFILDQVGINQ